MDAEKVALGSLLIAVSCFVLLRSGLVTGRIPLSAVALGAVGLSIASLLADSTGT